MVDSIEQRVRESTQISDFQKRVYLELLKVPRGQTISYGELAGRVGCKSAQAVGQALKRNPFSPEVPCHRVISASGKPGGFFGHTDGPMLERKRKLLADERDDFEPQMENL